MTALQLARVQNAIRLLTLIEGITDSTSYLDSCEKIDKRRRACGEAAAEAISDLELAFGLHWVPDISGQSRRRSRGTNRRAARKAVR